MKNATRKGSLLLVLAAICAMTLMWAPVSTHASTPGAGGETSWTDGSPGGGTTNGDPDKPDPSKTFAYPRWGSSLSVSPARGASGYPVDTVSSGTLRGWLQPLIWTLGVRLGGYTW